MRFIMQAVKISFGAAVLRDPALDIWITVHSAVYDIPNRTLRIVAQEDFDRPFVVRLR